MTVTLPDVGAPPEIPQEPPEEVPGFHGLEPYFVAGAKAAWSDVYSWVKTGWHALWGAASSAVTITADDVQNAIDIALGKEQQAWASFVGVLDQWMAAAVTSLTETIGWVALIATAIDQTLTAELQAAEQLTGALLANLEARLLQEMIAGDLALEQFVLHEVQGVEQWVQSQVVAPFLIEIQRLQVQIQDETQHVLQEAEGYSDLRLAASLAPVLAIIATIEQQVVKLQTENDECTEPMCETMGPNTNLGKWLKDLEALLGILAGVGLANLTAKDAERIASFFQAITTGTVDDFVNAFAGGGATLGSAGGAIVSDLGDIAGKALAEVSGL